jgi:uncharacterized protein (TIGR02466 family)
VNKKVMNVDRQFYTLFPTPVGAYKLNRSFSKKELTFLKGLKTVPNVNTTRSADSYILRNTAMKELEDFLKACVQDYLESIICPKTDMSLRITQSWVSYTKKGETFPAHAHPNSLVSGVMYIEADKSKDKILFNNPSLVSSIMIQPKQNNLFNSNVWWIPVGTGDVLLFPSTMYHSVLPIDTDNRISLAFNTFPTGHIGDEDHLTEVHL